MSRWEAGQVLFILSSRYHRVFVVQISEITTHKRANGEVVSYAGVLVDSPSEEYKLDVLLEDLGGELFSDRDAMRDVMIERATKAIDKMLEPIYAFKHDRPKKNEKTNDVVSPTPSPHKNDAPTKAKKVEKTSSSKDAARTEAAKAQRTIDPPRDQRSSGTAAIGEIAGT